MIPLFVTNALDGEPMPVYGDGRQTRDWLHVEDHCAAIELVLRDGEPGEVYNVGAGSERENLDVARAILQLDGRRPGAPPPRRGQARPRPPLLARHHEAARARLGARRGTSSDGLAETVEWYRAQRDWWEPLKSGEYLEYYRPQYADRLR